MMWADEGVVALLLFGCLRWITRGDTKPTEDGLVSVLNVPMQCFARFTGAEPVGPSRDICFSECPFCWISWPHFLCDSRKVAKPSFP